MAQALHMLPSRRSVVCGAVKVKSGKQVCCTKSFVAKPGHEQAVAKLVAGLTQYSLEQAKQRSHGIVVFEAVKDSWDSNVFHTWERYDSNVSLGKHNTSPQYQKFMQQVHDHLEQPIAMALYEWNEGRLGPVALAEGPKGEGGLDDATGASGAAGGASLKQTSASFNLLNIKEEEEAEHNVFSTGMEAAKKKMDSFKDMFGSMFGGKKDKEKELAKK